LKVDDDQISQCDCPCDNKLRRKWSLLMEFILIFPQIAVSSQRRIFMSFEMLVTGSRNAPPLPRIIGGTDLRRPKERRTMNRKTILLIAAVTFAAAPLASGASYPGTALYLLTPPPGFSGAPYLTFPSAAEGQVVGRDNGTATGGSGIYHALLWNGTSSAVDLTPAGFTYSEPEYTNGTQQVGEGYGTTTENNLHALLWSGTAASAIDLNPDGFASSVAWGVVGGQQVGYGTPTGDSVAVTHALLWSGTAGSVLDLNPSTLSDSEALATDGTQQVGWTLGVNEGGPFNALLWSGTAASCVNLNPAGFTYSKAFGVYGSEQVGVGITGGNTHAVLWYGTAASAIDLNPSGVSVSYAFGTNGTQQVGEGGSGGVEHAYLWSGTATSAVDLNSFLPSTDTWVDSAAASIDPSGNIFGVATDVSKNTYAVEWSPSSVPEPASLSLLSLGSLALLVRRRRSA
jgi:hypothetical protein